MPNVSRNPYRIQGSALLSVSGGRSSGYLLAHILEAHGGTLPDDIVCVFANTGEEHPGTLEFVREMSERWGVAIRWVEFCAEVPRWKEVTYCTASRKGEPFDALVVWKRYVPNSVARICSEHLKIRPSLSLAATLIGDDFDEVVGIRADEPPRVAKMRARGKLAPLASAGVTRGDVLAWWAAQPFDLRIPEGAGNCTTCFEKGLAQLHNVIRDGIDGGGADRMIARERLIGATMKKGHPFAKIAARARGQLPMWAPPPDVDMDLRPCACGDDA